VQRASESCCERGSAHHISSDDIVNAFHQNIREIVRRTLRQCRPIGRSQRQKAEKGHARKFAGESCGAPSLVRHGRRRSDIDDGGIDQRVPERLCESR
jgi:hypothetical protein